MSATPIDARALAAQELADATVPSPDDAFEDIGPMGRLMYLQMLGYETLKLWTATIALNEGEDIGDGGELIEAMNAIALACGNLDVACVAVGILDGDAIAPPSDPTDRPDLEYPDDFTHPNGD